MIEVRALEKSFGEVRVLDEVSLAVPRGQVAALIGPSGCGKSTLLRCLNGFEGFERGELRVGEIELAPSARARGPTLRELRRRVGMVFQQFNLFANMTVLENVAAGPRFVLGKPEDEAHQIARRLLERVDLLHRADAMPDRLSGGQQQRVAIARTLAVAPEAILFDEPTSALDPRMAVEVMRVIADLADDGLTMVVVTHAMSFARRIADTVHVMHGGRIVESGPPEQIFVAPCHEATRALLAHASST